MNRLKKLLPFVFPTAAIVLVIVLGVRWYRLRNEQAGQISEFAEGIEIEDLTTEVTNSGFGGVEDLMSQELKPQVEDLAVMGQVRYELVEGKIKFSVFANLPEPGTAQYQVWLQDLEGESRRKAFALTPLKGGYLGSASISTETLPFTILVSEEEVADNRLEEILLRGNIELPQDEIELELE